MRTVLWMWRKRAAALVLMGAVVAGCSDSGAVGEGTRFRKRDLPQPVWLDDTLSRLCLIGLPGGSTDGLACSLETDSVGGGAVFDFSDDGRPDIIWTNALFGPPVFLENLGGWRFRDVSDIIIGDADWGRVHGVAIGDIDNDGDGDIFFTRQNKQTALLLVNQGGGHFIDEAGSRGVAMDDGSPHFGGSAVFGDYDGDGWLDLHTTEHLLSEVSPETPLGHARLFRNLGGEGKPGVFEDVTISSGADRRVSPQVLLHFQSYFHDLDRDGTLDLHIITNHNLSVLLLNNGDGTFRDGSLELPLTNDESGMSAVIGDISGDGIADIFISALSQNPAAVGETRTCEDVRYAEARLGTDLNTGNRLFVAEGDGYVDMTDRYGVRNGGWGWGVIMADFANSGRLGIVQVGSRSMPADISFLYCVMPGTARPTIRYWEQDSLGELEEISASSGLRGMRRPKSPMTGDFDGDGDEDLVIFETAGVPLLFENTTQGAGARGITVSFGPKNHPANAVMRVTFTDGSAPIVRIAGVVNSLYATRYTDEIIGLGERAGIVANLRVDWPSGETITIEAPQPGERIELP